MFTNYFADVLDFSKEIRSLCKSLSDLQTLIKHLLMNLMLLYTVLIDQVTW